MATAWLGGIAGGRDAKSCRASWLARSSRDLVSELGTSSAAGRDGRMGFHVVVWMNLVQIDVVVARPVSARCPRRSFRATHLQ